MHLVLQQCISNFSKAFWEQVSEACIQNISNKTFQRDKTIIPLVYPGHSWFYMKWNRYLSISLEKIYITTIKATDKHAYKFPVSIYYLLFFMFIVTELIFENQWKPRKNMHHLTASPADGEPILGRKQPASFPCQSIQWRNFTTNKSAPPGGIKEVWTEHNNQAHSVTYSCLFQKDEYTGIF